MALHTMLMLFVAGLAGGTLTALVGGAAVITYPALIAAGIPPLPATTCNLTAAVLGAFFAALSDRSQLPPLNRALFGMIFASMLGAGAGAMLLLATPARFFEIMVPILLGFATCCSLSRTAPATGCARTQESAGARSNSASPA
jgi:uncharacterized membrane protein YfcA